MRHCLSSEREPAQRRRRDNGAARPRSAADTDPRAVRDRQDADADAGRHRNTPAAGHARSHLHSLQQVSALGGWVGGCVNVRVF